MTEWAKRGEEITGERTWGLMEKQELRGDGAMLNERQQLELKEQSEVLRWPPRLSSKSSLWVGNAHEKTEVHKQPVLKEFCVWLLDQLLVFSPEEPRLKI